MPSDRSRRTDTLRDGYSGVVAQQGRVILDRDFNALQGLTAERIARDALDFVGPCGTPDDGFRISLPQASPRRPAALEPAGVARNGVARRARLSDRARHHVCRRTARGAVRAAGGPRDHLQLFRPAGLAQPARSAGPRGAAPGHRQPAAPRSGTRLSRAHRAGSQRRRGSRAAGCGARRPRHDAAHQAHAPREARVRRGA